MDDKYDLDIAIQKALVPVDDWKFYMKGVEIVAGQEKIYERTINIKDSSFKGWGLPAAIIAYSSMGTRYDSTLVPLLVLAIASTIVPKGTIDIIDFKVYKGDSELSIDDLGRAGMYAVYQYLKHKNYTDDQIRHVLSRLCLETGDDKDAVQRQP